MDLFAVDQPFGFGHPLFRFGLRVGVEHLQLCSTQGLDAAAGVDFFYGHLTGEFSLLAHRRRGA